MTKQDILDQFHDINYAYNNCNMLDTLSDMIDQLIQAREWISVKGRLPEEKQSEITYDFEYVLCATTFGDVRPYKFGTPIGWKEPHFWHGNGLMDKYVTHWMPMPEPPKEG